MVSEMNKLKFVRNKPCRKSRSPQLRDTLWTEYYPQSATLTH